MYMTVRKLMREKAPTLSRQIEDKGAPALMEVPGFMMTEYNTKSNTLHTKTNAPTNIG
jgi:hypothetical protein